MVVNDVKCQELYKHFSREHQNFVLNIKYLLKKLKSKNYVDKTNAVRALHEEIDRLYSSCKVFYQDYMTYYSDDFFTMQSPNDYYIVVIIMDMIFLSTEKYIKIPRNYLEFMPYNCLPYLTDRYLSCYNYLFQIGGPPPCLGCYLHEEFLDRFILINKSFTIIQKYVPHTLQNERIKEFKFMKEFILSILHQYHNTVSEICSIRKINAPNPIDEQSDIETTILSLQQFIKKHSIKNDTSDVFFPDLLRQ